VFAWNREEVLVSIHAIKTHLSQIRSYLTVALLGLLVLFVALFLSADVAIAGTPASTAEQVIPTFSISAVARDQSVQILTNNFPANVDFVVRMGPMGTRAINGTYVTTVNSGSGGAINWSFAVPAAYAGSGQIAIRLESAATGYYAYNWFYNNSTAVAPQPPVLGEGGVGPTPPDPQPPIYTGIPTFSITAVERNVSVGILTNNFPANMDFDVRMGPYGTLGINGNYVATVNSGNGGAINWSFAVPAAYANQGRIAIRLENTFSGYYAYNWFFNNTTNPVPQPPVIGDGGTGPTPPDPVNPIEPPPAYTGFPTMAISNVVRNQSATARIYNLPPGTSCNTAMGPYGSLGYGYNVGAFNTDAGGTQDKTFTIPAELANSYRIAIRIDCGGGYFAYNWFYNNTASVPVP
jgi:hypothetical protein